MKIVVGLGNPGKKYQNTRHNTGWIALDALASKLLNCQIVKLSKYFKFQKKLQAEILKLDAKRYSLDTDYLLIKPQTFMNDSGLAVKKEIQLENLKIGQLDNLYVIHDDLDIPLGEYKIQFSRGPAGHKGVQSIIDHLGTKDFWRIRIGIGIEKSKVKSQKSKVKDEEFVLENFNKQERQIIDKIIKKATEQLICK
jgi:PTH1 family peptidyl-tRNA hydrolase